MAKKKKTVTATPAKAVTGFAARLQEAMGENHSAADLARYCDISPAAVSRWGDGGGIKPIHLFTISKRLGVNPEWLGTGVGKKQPGPQCLHDDIPQRRIDLIRMYGRLPAENRRPIRSLIEALAYLTHPSTAQYVRNQERVNHMVQDKEMPEKAK